MSNSAILRWRRSGRLHQVHRGVFQVGHLHTSGEGRTMAAVLASPGGSATHLTALQLWHVRPMRDGPIHLTAPSRRRSRPGLVIHQSRIDTEDLCAVDNIPLTAPARALLEFAELAAPDELERALNEAQALGLLTPGDLESLRERTPGHHGWGGLNRILKGERESGFSRKEAERRMFALVREAGLPRPQRNPRRSGYEVDLLWPEHRLVVEIDGWLTHGHRGGFERDRTKSADLQAEGVTVLRFTWSQITRRRLWVTARLAAALALARAREAGAA